MTAWIDYEYRRERMGGIYFVVDALVTIDLVVSIFDKSWQRLTLEDCCIATGNKTPRGEGKIIAQELKACPSNPR